MSIVTDPIDRLRSTDPKGPVVFFATPAYAGLHPLYVRSLLDATRELCASGYRVQHCFTIHQALIQNAREELFGHFLASGAQWMVMADGDIGWDKDLVRIILDFDKPLCAAAAPGRKLYIERAIESGKLQEAIGFNVAPSNHDELRKLSEAGEKFHGHTFIRVPLCATTFFVMRRDAAVAMADFYRRELKVKVAGTPSVAVFHPLIEDELHYGEDLSFFLRYVRMAATPIWAITTATLSHSGPLTITGCLDRTLFSPGDTEPVTRSWPYEEATTAADLPPGEHK
jgi:hypothetical protein